MVHRDTELARFKFFQVMGQAIFAIIHITVIAGLLLLRRMTRYAPHQLLVGFNRHLH